MNKWFLCFFFFIYATSVHATEASYEFTNNIVSCGCGSEYEESWKTTAEHTFNVKSIKIEARLLSAYSLTGCSIFSGTHLITIKINGETVYTTPAKTITSRLTQIYTFEDPVDFLLTEGDEIEFHWTAADQGCISGPNKLTFYGTTPILLPGKVNLISPSGIIGDNLVDFKWSTDDNSTWYKLLVWDDSGKTIHDNWYKSLGTCTESVCSANSVLELANETYKWWVIGWNENGSGPWSDGMEFTISASSNTPPSTATLISPKSTVSSPVTFSWNAVSDATWYQLWVNDQTGNKIKKWYTAAQTGCEFGTGTCSVTPSTTLDAGGATWWIQTWNNHGYGPWSPGMNFTTR